MRMQTARPFSVHPSWLATVGCAIPDLIPRICGCSGSISTWMTHDIIQALRLCMIWAQHQKSHCQPSAKSLPTTGTLCDCHTAPIPLLPNASHALTPSKERRLEKTLVSTHSPTPMVLGTGKGEAVIKPILLNLVAMRQIGE